jgi:hypothetical protein
MTRQRFTTALALVLVACSARVLAHNGPPFPIISDQVAGPYLVSIWTDPDTTDDGSPGGQFWVRIHLPGGGELPPETRATVSVSAGDRAASARTTSASPVRGDVTNQFAALFMDHEGRFEVRITIDGPRGSATVNSAVDATYDLRPPQWLFLLYLAPFVLVGLLWGKLLIRRRGMNRAQGRSN